MTSTWDKSLETGNALIDNQHREVIKLSDELKAANGSHAEARRVFDKLMEFVIVHFLSEEELMREVNYPADLSREMVEQHRDFKTYIRLRVLEFRQSEVFIVLPLQAFLDNWLKVHEFGLDRKLANWIRRKENDSRAA